MKKFNKFLTLLLTFSLTLSAFACTGGGNSTTTTSENTETTKSLSDEESSLVQSVTNSATSSKAESNSSEITVTKTSNSVTSTPSTTTKVSESSSSLTSASSSKPQVVLESISVSGQSTTANSLAEVSKEVTVTGHYSNGTNSVLDASSYKVFVEYKNASTAQVTVIHSGTGLTSSYDVALSAKVCEHTYSQTSFTEPTLTQKGTRVYTCSACSDTYSQDIPKLNITDYSVNSLKATCSQEGMDIYSSSVYGTYTVKTGAKLNHTTYNGTCEICQTGVGNLTYNYEDSSTVFWGASSYPRLIELKDGTWLCGFDTWGAGYTAGTIVVVRSTDKGKTWSKERTTVSLTPEANCANVALYQLENGDILCAYRAIFGEFNNGVANTSEPFTRALHVVISKDNGYTWQKHSTIVSSENLIAPNGTSFTKAQTADALRNVDQRLGFFEPHFGMINGKLTVMYADDLTTYMLGKRGSFRADYETQYIISRTWEGSSWSSANIVLDGTKQKTVSNSSGFSITDFSRDGMPVFDRLSNGTYVLVVEGTYRDNTLPSGSARTKDDKGNTIETHPFEILLSYSKDGITWTDPVEIYVPKGEGTKASAPYICVTEDDRIIVSFQTDEDAAAEKNLRGDGVSVMKTIISDGTPVENLTAANFYESQNPFFAPAGTVTSWNGMMEKDGYIYCVTGTNFPQSAIKMTKAKIPAITAKDYHTTSSPTGYNVRHGNFGLQNDGWYRSTSNDSIMVSSSANAYNGKISFDMIPNVASDCGVMFRVTEGANSYWEDGNSTYYFFFINFEGRAILTRVNGAFASGNTTAGNGVWNEIGNYVGFMSEYNPKELIHVDIEMKDHGITCSVNGKPVIHVWDDINSFKGLLGTSVGFRAQKPNTVFGNISIT